MTSIKEYASKHKVSHRTARRQLDRMVEVGEMVRTKGPSNMFVYEQKPRFAEMRWHDPFNKISVARSIQKDEGENTKAVARPAQVQQQKPLAVNGKAVAHSASIQRWFDHIRSGRADADNGGNAA